MSTNPVSFRVGFESQISNLPPEHQQVIRTVWNAITDLQGAIPALKTQIDTNKTAVTNTTNTVNTNTSSETIVNAPNVIGKVNNQSGVTSYSTFPSDYGAFVLLNDASPIAVTLTGLPVVQLPFYCTFFNFGAGSATLTPASGNINGAGTLSVPGGYLAIVTLDGVNWWAGLAPFAAGGAGVTQIIAGSNITISPIGGTGVVTINATGGGGGYSLGGTLTSGNIALGSGAGAGATLDAVAGLDGNHQIEITTGTSPAANAAVFTVTFTTTRGHVTYPLIQCVNAQVGHSLEDLSPGAIASATTYTAYSITALDASTTYYWNVSAP